MQRTPQCGFIPAFVQTARTENEVVHGIQMENFVLASLLFADSLSARGLLCLTPLFEPCLAPCIVACQPGFVLFPTHPTWTHCTHQIAAFKAPNNGCVQNLDRELSYPEFCYVDIRIILPEHSEFPTNLQSPSHIHKSATVTEGRRTSTQLNCFFLHLENHKIR